MRQRSFTVPATLSSRLAVPVAFGAALTLAVAAYPAEPGDRRVTDPTPGDGPFNCDPQNVWHVKTYVTGS
jgi:hypothetical protein